MTSAAATPASPGPVAIEVVPMRRRHLRQVLRIDAQQAGDRWSPGLFMAELRRGEHQRCYRVALCDGAVVGFAGMLFIDGDGHLATVAVDTAHRRRGVATTLLAELATRARHEGCTALTLEVRAGNVEALALYRQFGFAPAGVRKGYYSDNGEDALVLWAEGIDSDAYAARLAHLTRQATPPVAASPTSSPTSSPASSPAGGSPAVRPVARSL